MRIKYSVIIPHRDSVNTLNRLLNSIPNREDIEILIVDNSLKPINRTDIGININFKLLYSAPERFAGGARNVGIDAAVGDWLVFCDADDFFHSEAFSVFDRYEDKGYDLVYFKADSVYDDTLLPSDRADMFSDLVDNYLQGKVTEITCRLYYTVPWGKMVKKDFVDSYNIRFDEVRAANDVFFSTLTGYYTKRFTVSDDVVYTVTVRKGSITQTRSYDNLLSRYLVFLRRNKFFKEHRLRDMQVSVMYFIYNSLSFGIEKLLYFLWLSIKYRQNIFIGMRHWYKTKLKLRASDKKDQQYIVR